MNVGVSYLDAPRKIEIKVADVMRRKPIVADPDAPLKQLADIMVKKGFREIIVMDGNRILGILTDSEVLRALTRGRDLESLAAKDVDLHPAVTVTATMDVLTAMKVMRSKGVKRLVVVNDDERVVGVVDGDDLLDVVPMIIDYLM